MCNVCPRPRGLCSLDLAWSRDLRLSGPPSIDHMNLCLTQTTHVDWSIRRNGPAFLTYKLDYKCEEARILSWISILLSSILLGFESLFKNSLYQIRDEKFFHPEFTYQIRAEGFFRNIFSSNQAKNVNEKCCNKWGIPHLFSCVKYASKTSDWKSACIII